MSNNSGNIWIDVTDLSIWSGHFTGTQRVTYEMSKRFYEREPRAKFFVYNDKQSKFHEVSFELVNSLGQRSSQSIESSATVKGRLSVKSSLKNHMAHTYGNMPPYLKKHLTPNRKESLKKAYRFLERSMQHPRASLKDNRLRSKFYNSPAIIFQSSDTVIIFGKPWDTMEFIYTLRAQKITQSFKLVHLVHDMVPVFMPHVFGQPLPQDYTEYMFEAMGLCDHVIAISKSTKNDVVRFCHEMLLPVPAITVTTHGDDFAFNNIDRIPFPELLDSGFILCVGTIEIRKNHILLYTAYREAVRRGVSLPLLVIVGSKGWYTNDVLYELQNDPAIKDSVKIMHGISDEELTWLYSNCLFTVYPSVYEGWGLPVAESLSYGKVCIASNTSSMPEVAGDLIDYFSPYNSTECLELIKKYLDEKTRINKEGQIKKLYVPRKWDDTFKQIHNIVTSAK